MLKLYGSIYLLKVCWYLGIPAVTGIFLKAGDLL